MKLSALLLVSTSVSLAAAKVSGWGFSDGTVSVFRGTDKISKNKDLLSSQILSDTNPLADVVHLGADNKLTVTITTTSDGDFDRPHQAFLTFTTSGNSGEILQESFPFNVKPSSKSTVEVTQNILPHQFLRADGSPIDVSIILASFGSSHPYRESAFKLIVDQPEEGVAKSTGPPPPKTPSEPPVRYHALPEIHHIFRPEPQSPPVIVSIGFTSIVVSLLPVFFIIWFVGMGANVRQASIAVRDAPIAHAVFASSIISIEGLLVLYYATWNLFQMLPVLITLGVVALVSGSRALSEVQARRVKGLR